jgi:hypothetical protein
MEKYKGQHTEIVYGILSTDGRVVSLLTAIEPGAMYKRIKIKEGEVTPGWEEALGLLKPSETMKTPSTRYKKDCAKGFCSKINSYVYCNGNRNEPQMWPLIHKVTLH